jgi:hypothetical protein
MTAPLLFRLLGVTIEECGEYLLYGFMRAPAGASRIDSKGEDLNGKGLYTGDEVREKLWAHTVVETRTEAETA